MLTYLSASSQTDIAFAIHQCAHFSQHPMRIHEIAIRRIICYLHGTSSQGYLLRPTLELPNLDCYVDADSGLWDNCAVLWVSKLQNTEAEYIALSQAMRDLIPMRALLLELAASTNLRSGATITHSTIFEDNKDCVELVQAPKMRPCTKHIAIKYHHFRSHIACGGIKIQWINTKHQLADIFTKSLYQVYNSPPFA